MTLQMKRVISLVICVMFGATLMLSCTKGRKAKYSKADRQRFISTHNLGRLPKSDVPLEMNERVIAWMDYFSGSGARHFRKYLQRSGKYVPMMRQILKKNGVPQDLVYIALIESGFNNHARSHASAVGPWQFIRSTGKHYGLRIDSWVDERRDPVKATHAASKFFKKLYGDYANWYLAMAGYNAGEGRVNSAIRKSGSKNFWVHANPNKKFLKPETRDYVPKYIAATIMAKMPEKFGFGNVEYDKPLNYEIVVIDSQTDLVVAGKCAGVSRSTLELLNPELRLGSTPPGVRNYGLKVPKGRKERFKVAYVKVPRKERIKLVTHKVRNRETLAKVARKYGVSTKALARANGMGRKSRLHAGTELVIPIGAAYRQRVAKAETYSGGGRKKIYRVRRGDTLGGIAHKHRVKVSQLKKWNRIRGTRIRVGQKLKIYGRGGRTRVASSGKSGSVITRHTVRRGDTVGGIAVKYGVKTADLRRWNGIKGNRIRAGQKLTVRSPTSKVASKRGTSRTTGGTYVVKSGDTPGTIAQKHGVRTSQLVAWNGLNKKRPVVRVGQRLTIKGGKVAKKSQGAPLALNKTSTKTTTKRSSGGTHTLASGQTLGHVAQMYGVSSKDIMRWNGIKNPTRVRAGRKLKIKGGKKKVAVTKKTTVRKPAPSRVEGKTAVAPAPQASGMAPATKTKTVASVPTTTTQPVAKPATAPAKKSSRKYKIKSGDSLWSVAQKHNVSVSEIKKWNGLGKSNKIKPGQSIVIKK